MYSHFQIKNCSVYISYFSVFEKETWNKIKNEEIILRGKANKQESFTVSSYLCSMRLHCCIQDWNSQRMLLCGPVLVSAWVKVPTWLSDIPVSYSTIDIYLKDMTYSVLGRVVYNTAIRAKQQRSSQNSLFRQAPRCMFKFLAQCHSSRKLRVANEH